MASGTELVMAIEEATFWNVHSGEFWEGDRVHRKLLLVGLLVVGVAMLTGCDVFNHLIDSIGGGGTPPPGGGTNTPGEPIGGRMEFKLDATIWRDDRYTAVTSYEGSVGTTFWSSAGVFHDGLFEAHWNGGDFSDTALGAVLSADGQTITDFAAEQTQANIWGGYTHYNYIEGVNLPFSHIEGNSRFYRVEGAAAQALVAKLNFKMWVPDSETGGGFSDPIEWIVVGADGTPVGLTGSADDYIEIRLDYPNAATSP
jgi:hypothetical protein